MKQIHWLGNGLSSVPGIQRLASRHNTFILWCRRTDDGRKLLAGCKSQDVRSLKWDALEESVSKGDVVVSMLPASEHIRVAKLCLKCSAHFVSSSYVSDEMRNLHHSAKSKQLTFINEIGLDPGLDHLLAHDLIERFKNSDLADGDYQHSFRSYCGGFPMVPDDFKYKFSWSPVGVLKALNAHASWIVDSTVRNSNSPWRALSRYSVPALDGEEFQAYPNRDSIPFLRQYHIPESWKISEFVRGTLRLDGWAEAWADIFQAIDSTPLEKTEIVLQEMSNELWKKHAYQPSEADRVVLSVEHEVKQGDKTVWHHSYHIDETGNERGSAMARLVSLPVSLAIESILEGALPAGILAASDDAQQIHQWLDTLRSLGEVIQHTEHPVQTGSGS